MTFDSKKVYLLVGCLGGLGRSLSRWMMLRGARNFVFLGRSGCRKPEARRLVSRLRNAGATVTVVQGDVCSQDDVNMAVAACEPLPIGGVVQAAMGLSEALFSHMTSDAWHKAIQPKLTGSWNLHTALESHDEALDFFLLASSVSGSVGTATESNYCAANAFLDAFAHWRRSQNKPAVSIGLGMISEVGYLHENPEIESLLLRRGVQPLDEDEFLQIIDMALAPETNEPDRPGMSHVLTGLEPTRVHELLSRGYDVSHATIQDPRASIIAGAFRHGHKENRPEDVSGRIHLASPPWLKTAPTNVVRILAEEMDAPSMLDAILRLTRKQFSTLILVPLEHIDDNKSLSAFGVDSMIAAELRSWIWTALKVDIPFVDILGHHNSLRTLSHTISRELARRVAAKVD